MTERNARGAEQVPTDVDTVTDSADQVPTDADTVTDSAEQVPTEVDTVTDSAEQVLTEVDTVTDSESSTECVPVADRGPRRFLPPGITDELVQTDFAKKRRFLHEPAGST